MKLEAGFWSTAWQFQLLENHNVVRVYEKLVEVEGVGEQK